MTEHNEKKCAENTATKNAAGAGLSSVSVTNAILYAFRAAGVPWQVTNESAYPASTPRRPLKSVTL